MPKILRQFNFAYALATIIPMLICCYLITVRFFTISILFSIHGVYFLLAVLFALLGLLLGRRLIEAVIQQLIQAHAETQRLVVDLASVNARLTQELTQRQRAEQALKQEKIELEQLNKLMVGRESRIMEMKKEVEALLQELGRPSKYTL